MITTLALATIGATAASAGDLRTSTIFTHPSRGDVTAVDGAVARMTAMEEGVFVNFETAGLKPGHAHTLWFVTVGNPAACAKSPCTGKDVLLSSDAVQSDAGFAGGVIADDEGRAIFAAFQPVGPVPGGWFGHGFTGADTSEVHLVIKDHGPLIEGREAAMLGTFRDACTEESIPAPFPAISRADGMEGPNTCALVQFSIF